jgi:hypothetical protein
LDAGVDPVEVEPHDQRQHQRHQAEYKGQPPDQILFVVRQEEDDGRGQQRPEDSEG